MPSRWLFHVRFSLLPRFSSALRNLIREGKSYQIYSVIETGHQYGMQAMDRILADLYRGDQVLSEEAATRAIDHKNFNRLMKEY